MDNSLLKCTENTVLNFVSVRFGPSLLFRPPEPKLNHFCSVSAGVKLALLFRKSLLTGKKKYICKYLRKAGLLCQLIDSFNSTV